MASQNTDDGRLDETLEESFPASDAPANTPETGIRTAAPSTPEVATVTENPAQQRFELTVNGETAFLQYERTAATLTIVHTEVPPAIRGHHVAERLVEAGIAAAHASGLRLIVICPFARAYMRRRHPTNA